MSFQQQQQQQDEADQAVLALSLSVAGLEDAMNLLLSSNFDADSRVCIITLMKMLDNVLHKPFDEKVRSIRLQNQTFTDKVGRRRGGIEFLQACGFTQQAASSSLLLSSSSSSSATQEQLLVLHTVNEKTSHLITARRLLQTRAVQDLNMKLEDLPVLKTPMTPPAISFAAGTAASTTSTFNVYAGHRYDVQSAAAGTNLGPDANYKSSTEVQLQSLQKQQQALQKKLQQPLVTSKDRQWRAWDASSSNQTILAATAATAAAALGGGAGTASGGGTGGDSSLLAARLQKQQRDRQQLEEGGFTTAAMRQVERLKKQKVYSHVQLTIQFADGCKLTGKFIPHETLETVRNALIQSCFVLPQQQQEKLDFDLYVTPPRRILQDKKTLEQEGLAPAAKIFCSFKNYPKPPTPTTAIGGRFILRPELFADSATDMAAATTMADINTPAFPIAKPIVAESSKKSSDTTMQNGDDGDSKPSAKPKKKVSREDALLNRMMGRK